MAQDSWKLEKDETDCGFLKPPSSPQPPAPPPTPPTPQSPPPICTKSPAAAAAAAPRPDRVEGPMADSDGVARRAVEPPKQVRFMNRCSSCQKKVGLAGFRCRCGALFCGRHRHSETHDCFFDYKSAGREEIAKANPVVRAAKIIKI